MIDGRSPQAKVKGSMRAGLEPAQQLQGSVIRGGVGRVHLNYAEAFL